LRRQHNVAATSQHKHTPILKGKLGHPSELRCAAQHNKVRGPASKSQGILSCQLCRLNAHIRYDAAAWLKDRAGIFDNRRRG
jgi:hypothetical protein